MRLLGIFVSWLWTKQGIRFIVEFRTKMSNNLFKGFWKKAIFLIVKIYTIIYVVCGRIVFRPHQDMNWVMHRTRLDGYRYWRFCPGALNLDGSFFVLICSPNSRLHVYKSELTEISCRPCFNLASRCENKSGWILHLFHFVLSKSHHSEYRP